MIFQRKQPVQTRMALLEAAGVEFSRHGYAGAGLGSIVARAGMTKGALFHHFADKRSMAEAWVGEILAREIAACWITPLETQRSLEDLRTFLRTRLMDMRPGDAVSALVALAAETSQMEDSLAEALARVFHDWRAAVADWLERGKNAGWIHRSIQPVAEAAFLVSLIAGMTVTTPASHGTDLRRHGAEALAAYLETLRTQ